jgi:hypothetical protein
MHKYSRFQRVFIYAFAAGVVALVPPAAQSVGSVVATGVVDHRSATLPVVSSSIAKPSMHSIADLGPSPRLRSALEGLDTSDYRTTLMMCEE